MPQLLVFFLFLLFSFQAFSQDTVAVYFEFGSSKLSKEAKSRLGNLSDNYDLSVVDSAQIIGYADSVGKVSENIRLSLRRAKSVNRACKFTLSEIEPITLHAKGEGTLSDPALNRRVEVILFSRSIESDAEQVEIVQEDANPKCFFIDFEALEYCHIRTIKKRRKEVVFIEAMDVEEINDRDHFYANTDRNGEVSVRKVRWKPKSTGILWWKKKRLVTTIPKDGFDKFHFFTLENDPCDGCKETVLTEDTLILNRTTFYEDRFLEDNLQVKVRFFKKDELKIRAPRMYIDEEDKYYWLAGEVNKRTSAGKDQEVNWNSKRGKKRKNYLYARVPHLHDQDIVLARNRKTTECRNLYRDSGSDYRGIHCGTHWNGVIEGFQFNLDAGAFYQTDTATAFVALGVSHTTKNGYSRLLGGLNHFMGFYGSAAYQYHYFTFPFQSLSPTNTWRSASETKLSSVYGRLFLGVEVKSSSKFSEISFFEGNLHAGLVVVNANEGSFFPRFYLQGGVGHDFSGRITQRFYPIIQIGCTINLGSFVVRRR